jgi:6,7-dimethyl-8-ribityllumazine synthase
MPSRRSKTRVVILAADFHPPISRALVLGACRVFSKAGIPPSRLTILRAPGAFELPLLASGAVRKRPKPDAIVALGAVIRGDTAQYEVIAHAAAQGLMQVAVQAGVPITFGLIVADTVTQAKARAGGAIGNRGAEAAEAALAVLRELNRT